MVKRKLISIHFFQTNTPFTMSDTMVSSWKFNLHLESKLVLERAREWNVEIGIKENVQKTDTLNPGVRRQPSQRWCRREKNELAEMIFSKMFWPAVDFVLKSHQSSPDISGVSEPCVHLQSLKPFYKVNSSNSLIFSVFKVVSAQTFGICNINYDECYSLLSSWHFYTKMFVFVKSQAGYYSALVVFIHFCLRLRLQLVRKPNVADSCANLKIIWIHLNMRKLCPTLITPGNWLKQS